MSGEIQQRRLEPGEHYRSPSATRRLPVVTGCAAGERWREAGFTIASSTARQASRRMLTPTRGTVAPCRVPNLDASRAELGWRTSVQRDPRTLESQPVASPLKGSECGWGHGLQSARE